MCANGLMVYLLVLAGGLELGSCAGCCCVGWCCAAAMAAKAHQLLVLVVLEARSRLLLQALGVLLRTAADERTAVHTSRGQDATVSAGRAFREGASRWKVERAHCKGLAGGGCSQRGVAQGLLLRVGHDALAGLPTSKAAGQQGGRVSRWRRDAV